MSITLLNERELFILERIASLADSELLVEKQRRVVSARKFHECSLSENTFR